MHSRSGARSPGQQSACLACQHTQEHLQRTSSTQDGELSCLQHLLNTGSQRLWRRLQAWDVDCL
jgi:hypothetical protein